MQGLSPLPLWGFALSRLYRSCEKNASDTNGNLGFFLRGNGDFALYAFSRYGEMNGWGGKRKGAGRPLIGGVPRKPRPIRATDDEWELIKEFAKIARLDINKARELVKK